MLIKKNTCIMANKDFNMMMGMNNNNMMMGINNTVFTAAISAIY